MIFWGLRRCDCATSCEKLGKLTSHFPRSVGDWTPEEHLINQCFDPMLASLARRIIVVGLRGGTEFFRLSSECARSFASLPTNFSIPRDVDSAVRKRVEHYARWCTAYMYILRMCIHARGLGTWKHIHELEWACERKRRACLSDAI